ncbi:MAG: hypothetical protein OQJ89_06935, partial [Kangiellaceae bacterium]|nr:hypothetical protein [Kangiellaceae bacterium]
MKLKSSFDVANTLFSLYAILLTMLWMLLNYGGKGSDPYTGSGIRWFLITIPLLGLIFLNFLILSFRPVIAKDGVSISLILYTFGMTISSIYHNDLKLFSEVARWILPLFFVAHFKPKISIEVVNFLYLTAIILCIFTYNPSETDYGYLPGQTTVNLHQGLWWRVSLWKYLTPPYSAAFSVLVFVANYFLNQSRSRYLIYALCLYFIVLSGNRTSYLVFTLVFAALFLYQRNQGSFGKLLSVYPFLSVAFIYILQLLSDLIPLIGIQSELINSFLLRNEGGEDVGNLSSRILIMLEHYRIMQEASLGGFLGVGSEVYASPQWTSNDGSLGGTTDSYLTHLIVRDGIFFVFLVLGFVSFFYQSIKSNNIMGYMLLLALLLYTIGYGAWL